MKKKAFLITNIEEYGKFISFCINKDISVFRTYWDEQEKGKRCYYIDWEEKRCKYSSWFYYENRDYEIVSPIFQLDEYGEYKVITQSNAE